ncbi:MAG: phosphoribosylaminoimidazolesuccinocarboxamide synthase [Angustibacter sp.]
MPTGSASSAGVLPRAPAEPPALPGWQAVASGKVRDLYQPADGAADRLLLVASDRISAFDHVLATPIPGKGQVLTQLSLWWFEQLADLVPHHLLDDPVPDAVRGRAVVVRRLRMVPVECVARAYLTGSGLTEYDERRAVCGVPLPTGLVEGSRLPEPIFTPTTKAPIGAHDEPMTYGEVEGRVGPGIAARLREVTTAILRRGNEIAQPRGILVADTKIELGVAADGELVLADEVLTPDSSRFWPAQTWSPGGPQPSFDKQYVRDWLASPASGWDRHGGEPPPALPEDVVDATRARYVEAYERLTGRTFDQG